MVTKYRRQTARRPAALPNPQPSRENGMLGPLDPAAGWLPLVLFPLAAALLTVGVLLVQPTALSPEELTAARYCEAVADGYIAADAELSCPEDGSAP